jgi:hypothetical protein
MHTLFESHPKIKNCMNTMTPKERRGVDYSIWESDSNGFIHCVETLIPEYSFEDKLLWEDAEANKDIDSSGMLPLEVQDWMAENTTGLWFYEIRFCTDKAHEMFYKQLVFTFHFEKANDAIHFKLRWIR